MNKNQRIGVILIVIIIPLIIILLVSVKWLELADFKTYIFGAVLLFSSLLITTNTLKDKTLGSYSKRIFPIWFRKPKFKAEITNEQRTFVRETMILTFQSEYYGKLKNGYFMNEILLPENNRINMFSRTIPNLSPDGQSVMSFCNETIEDSKSRKGLLNGWRKSVYTWNWNIPNQNDMPLGNYRVRMMVFNEGNVEPLRTIEDTFEVINQPNDSRVTI